MKFASCDCRRVEPPADYADMHRLEFGDFYWDQGKLFVRLPGESRGYTRGLPIYREGEPKPAANAWKWDGNLDAPTLEPSINALSGGESVWHGYLRAGRLEACE